jgi:hypothetical protein
VDVDCVKAVLDWEPYLDVLRKEPRLVPKSEPKGAGGKE